MAESSLSAERLREVLHYDPLTGIFSWRVKTAARIKVGDVAGSINKHGYRYVHFDGVNYRANRLAWFYVHGEWPEHTVDHINGVKSDDRFTNLRDVTHQKNVQNERRARSNTKTGLLGVTRHKRAGGQWRADIGVNGKNVYLGLFPTPEQAHAAYLEAKRKLHEGCTI
jgi:hypothetical protein